MSHEDSRQVTKSGRWHPGGDERQEDCYEGSEHTEVVKRAGRAEQKSAYGKGKGSGTNTPPVTLQGKSSVETYTDAIHCQPNLSKQDKRQVKTIQASIETTCGNEKPTSGKGGATRPPKGRSKGKGEKARLWERPTSFALHVSEEKFTAITPTKEESLVNTQGSDD